MSRWLLAVRVVLALIVVGVVATYVAIQIHERANIVDLEVLPPAAAPGGAKPTPVQSRDVPSEEVREHVDFYPGGGPGCAPPNRGGVAISTGFQGQVTIGTRAEFCAEGFVGNKEISLRISGHGLRMVANWMPPRNWSWNVPPHLLPGRYSVRAVQGRRSASARVEAITSPEPFVRIRSFANRPSIFEVVVGGGPPSRRVPIHLYRAANPTTYRRDYLSTVAVPTDARGNGSIALRGTGGSTYTCYAVLPGFGGVGRTENQFCFGRPDLD